MSRFISRMAVLIGLSSLISLGVMLLIGGTQALDVLFYVALPQQPGAANTRFVSNVGVSEPIYAIIDMRTGVIHPVNNALPANQSTPDMSQTSQPHNVLLVQNALSENDVPEVIGRLDLRDGELKAVREADRGQPPVITGAISGIANDWSWVLLRNETGVIYLAAGGPNLTNYVRDPIAFNLLQARATPLRDNVDALVHSQEFAIFLPDDTFVLRAGNTLYHYAARYPEAGLIGVIRDNLPDDLTVRGYSAALDRLVITQGKALFLMDITTGDISAALAIFDGSLRVTLSPDGAWAVVLEGLRTDAAPAYSVNLRDGTRYPLDPEFEFDADSIVDARWSGNSQHLTLRANRNDGSRLALVVAEPDGANMHVLSNRVSSNYGWSPGGRYLFFMEEGAPPTSGFIYDAVAGGDAVEIAKPMLITRWDEDADVLYYLNVDLSGSGDGRLYRYDPRSGTYDVLTVAEQRVWNFAPMSWD